MSHHIALFTQFIRPYFKLLPAILKTHPKFVAIYFAPFRKSENAADATVIALASPIPTISTRDVRDFQTILAALTTIANA